MCEGSQSAILFKIQMNTFECCLVCFSKSPEFLLWSNYETIPSNGFHKRHLNGEASKCLLQVFVARHSL